MTFTSLRPSLSDAAAGLCLLVFVACAISGLAMVM